MLEITIRLDPSTGQLQVLHPPNVLLTLGLLEAAKFQVQSAATSQPSGIAVATPGALLPGMMRK